MTFFISEELSPSQIGPHRTRMSALMTFCERAGHSSWSQPCSVMSGQVATS